MDSVRQFLSAHWPPFGNTALRVVLVVVGAAVLASVLKRAIHRLRARLAQDASKDVEHAENGKRVETLAHLLEQASVVAIWIVGALVVLSQLGVAVGPLLAGAGIAGVAVGFGAQALVRDVISGFFLILENQVRVGDVATVNGTTGLVERITLRTIVLRDVSGIVHVFPNGVVSTLANLTSGWSAYVVALGVSYSQDTDVVVEVMKQVGAELKSDPTFGPLMIADIEVFGVDQFADSAVVIKGRLRTRPGKHMDVGREYNRRIKKAFDAKGIEIPFPQRTVHAAKGASPLALD